MVTRQSGYNSFHFRANRVTTPGGLVYTTFFNISVDSVVRHWLSLMVEDIELVCDGMGCMVGHSLGILYADDGPLGSQDPEWLQGSLNVLIGLLWRIILADNVAKSKTVTFQTGTIISGMSQELFVKN